MAEFFSDSFDGVAGDNIQAYNPAWTAVPGITGTAVIGTRFAARGNGGFYRSDAPSPSADFSVTGEIYISSAVNGPNLAVLADVSTTAATYYQANLIGGTGIRLARTVNGSTLAIDTVPYTVVAGNTVRLRLERKGSNLSLYVDDALAIGPVEDTAIASTGYVGFRILNAGAGQLQLDSISAETLAAVEKPIVGSAGWLEQSETATIGADASATLQTGWTEQPESIAAVAALGSAARAAWVETAETNTIAAVIGGAGSIAVAWYEGAETTSIAVFAELDAVAGWIEGADAWAARLAVQPPGEGIDISKISAARIVVFEGSGSRVVVFEGSGRRVTPFEGSGSRVTRFD